MPDKEIKIEIHAPRWLHPVIMPLVWGALHAVAFGHFCARMTQWQLRRLRHWWHLR